MKFRLKQSSNPSQNSSTHPHSLNPSLFLLQGSLTGYQKFVKFLSRRGAAPTAGPRRDIFRESHCFNNLITEHKSTSIPRISLLMSRRSQESSAECQSFHLFLWSQTSASVMLSPTFNWLFPPQLSLSRDSLKIMAREDNKSIHNICRTLKIQPFNIFSYSTPSTWDLL